MLIVVILNLLFGFYLVYCYILIKSFIFIFVFLGQVQVFKPEAQRKDLWPFSSPTCMRPRPILYLLPSHVHSPQHTNSMQTLYLCKLTCTNSTCMTEPLTSNLPTALSPCLLHAAKVALYLLVCLM